MFFCPRKRGKCRCRCPPRKESAPIMSIIDQFYSGMCNTYTICYIIAFYLVQGCGFKTKTKKKKGTKVSVLRLLLPTMSAMKCCEPLLYPSYLIWRKMIQSLSSRNACMLTCSTGVLDIMCQTPKHEALNKQRP